MPNPTQPARLFRGLSTDKSFQRDYETQNSVPIDGSNPILRTYSPFVIRALLPTILGETNDQLASGVRPRSASARSGPNNVIDSILDNPSYSDALRDSRRADPSRTTYEQLLNTGSAIPGLAEANLVDLDRATTNFAVNQSTEGNLPQNRDGSGSSGTRVTPAITNDASGLSIVNQLRKLLDVPPLVLLINPTTFSVSHTKIAQFQERSRHGYIYQAWGEELTKVSFSCTIGAFTAGKASPSQTNTPSGVQFASKNDSASFQQLMAMLSFFQSGAYITDTVQNSKANLMIGNLAIEYDQNVYVGHMDSFSYSFAEEKQNGGLELEIDFTAIRVYDQAPSVSVVSRMNNPGTGALQPPNVPSAPNRLSRTFLSGNSEAQFFSSPAAATPEPSGPNPWRIQPQPASSTQTLSETARQILTSTGGLQASIPGDDFVYAVGSTSFSAEEVISATVAAQSDPALRRPNLTAPTSSASLNPILVRRRL